MERNIFHLTLLLPDYCFITLLELSGEKIEKKTEHY
ncbi:hypothetical protein BDD30_3597 [Photorhabdus asymbiotica]|uniref:Uncharacterized protein n=1 Tax=Photorhabdus asymbiotica TaxID=291112 RepID=A0ABX9SJF9_9GAMM|nr:hypothetical protein BDD30_3597 [Photorhabdus asymbiotica]